MDLQFHHGMGKNTKHIYNVTIVTEQIHNIFPPRVIKKISTISFTTSRFQVKNKETNIPSVHKRSDVSSIPCIKT